MRRIIQSQYFTHFLSIVNFMKLIVDSNDFKAVDSLKWS